MTTIAGTRHEARRGVAGLMVLGALLLGAGPAGAATITFSTSQNFTGTGPDGNAGFTGVTNTAANLFPQFDASLGTLTGVTFAYSVTVDFNGSCSGSSQFSCDTRVESSIAGSNGLMVSASSSLGFIESGNFDSLFIGSINAAYSGSVALSPSPFIGSGQLGDILASVTIRNGNPGGSAIYTNLAAIFVGTYALTYTYTPSDPPPPPVPEPGSLALLGLGVAGLAAVRRRRQ